MVSLTSSAEEPWNKSLNFIRTEDVIPKNLKVCHWLSELNKALLKLNPFSLFQTQASLWPQSQVWKWLSSCVRSFGRCGANFERFYRRMVASEVKKIPKCVECMDYLPTVAQKWPHSWGNLGIWKKWTQAVYVVCILGPQTYILHHF